MLENLLESIILTSSSNGRSSVISISKKGVSNYFFGGGAGVVAPEAYPESRCLKGNVLEMKEKCSLKRTGC
jgi:hypothetical protein